MSASKNLPSMTQKTKKPPPPPPAAAAAAAAANITNNKAKLSWPPLFLQDCCTHHTSHQATTAALQQILNECQTQEDLEAVEAFSIRLLQEARFAKATSSLPSKSIEIQRAKEMTTPYGDDNDENSTEKNNHQNHHYHHAEEGENLFHVLTSLLQPADTSTAAVSMNHNNHNNTATRSAKALWSEETANRMLWAKQAWENPGLLPRRKESMTNWVDTWCLRHSLQVEKWILLLDPRDFRTVPQSSEQQQQQQEENVVLDWLASSHWEWLQSKLGEALKAWRLKTKFPSLSNELIQQHWKSNSSVHRGRVVVMQCLVFIARVYCTTVALDRDALESGTLLAKIVRCADILSKEVAKVIETIDLSVLYPASAENIMTRKRELASAADEECTDAPAAKVARPSSIDDAQGASTSSSLPDSSGRPKEDDVETNTCSALSKNAGSATSPDQGKQDVKTTKNTGKSDNDESGKPTSTCNNVQNYDDAIKRCCRGEAIEYSSDSDDSDDSYKVYYV